MSARLLPGPHCIFLSILRNQSIVRWTHRRCFRPQPSHRRGPREGRSSQRRQNVDRIESSDDENDHQQQGPTSCRSLLLMIDCGGNCPCNSQLISMYIFIYTIFWQHVLFIVKSNLFITFPAWCYIITYFKVLPVGPKKVWQWNIFLGKYLQERTRISYIVSLINGLLFYLLCGGKQLVWLGDRTISHWHRSPHNA